MIRHLFGPFIVLGDSLVNAAAIEKIESSTELPLKKTSSFVVRMTSGKYHTFEGEYGTLIDELERIPHGDG